MKNLFDLSGKTAVITGGAGLLGVHHARALLQLNCSVDLWDLNPTALQSAKNRLELEFKGGKIHTSNIDITSEQDIISAVESYRKQSLNLDILINNAALNPKFHNESSNTNSRLECYPLDSWNREIAVGLTGAMLCSKHLGSYMADLGKGVILNISSDLSVISPDQRIYEVQGVEEDLQFKKPVSYSVIKAGLIGLTRYLSTYWSESGVRANSLSPGGVYDNHDPEFVNNLISRIPLARMAAPDEYVGAIQFLCSDASSYMNGQNLVIDGGRSVW